jgi:hypothetical protein
METIEEKAKEAYKEATDPETGGECFFHYTDEMIYSQGFSEGYKAAFEWISVDKELPKNETYILMLEESGISFMFYESTDEDSLIAEHTHWRPIEIN